MAADTEQRTIQIVLKAQEANASIKEMAAGAAVMTAQLSRMGQDDPGRAQLLADLQTLNQRLVTQRAEMRDLGPVAQQVIVDGQKVSATFNEMKAAAAQLEKQLGDLSHDDPGRAKMLADYKALQERIGEVREEMGQTEEKESLLKKAFAFAGVEVGVEAALDGLKELGAEIVNTTKEVAELRSSINTMTGATGQELDDLTTSVLSVSRTFGKDFNEVLGASNTLSKQMGVSQQEAMRLIQQGFLAGADAGGDFLDQVKEYAPQFKNAGFAADEFIGHISQSATQGIFSDKGADVVKEFGLRIREQTKSTSDAMQAAFGSDFTKQIFDGINSGSLTVEQALQKVAKEMDETKVPANQLQTVIADVFGGPGEDAGIDYLKSLKNVGTGVDALVDKTNAYTQRQQNLLESNQELAAAQNTLTKQFEGGGMVMDTLTNKSMTLLYTLLASLGATFKELFEPVQQMWKSFTDLAASLGFVSEGMFTAKSMGELLGAVVRAAVTPARWLLTAISALYQATLEWAKGNEVARTALTLLTLPVRVFFELLSHGPEYFAGFAAAAASAFGTIGRAWQRLKSGDFSGVKQEFATLGTDAGAAFRKAFDDASAKKATSAATTQDAGDNQPQRTQGGDGITDADRQKAADKAQKAREKAAKEAKAAQDKIDQQHLDDLKSWVKNEGDVLDTRNLLTIARQEAANTDELKRREAQRQKIIDDTDKKYQALELLDGNHTLEMQALVEERDLQLRELQAKFDEQDEQERQKKLAKALADEQADEEVEKSALEVKRANGAISEQQYQDQLYDITRKGLEKRLALLVAAGQGESSEAKKIQAALLKGQADHITKDKKQQEDLKTFNLRMAASGAQMLSEGLKLVEDNLDKKSEAYQAFKAARKVAEVAEIGINLAAEIQSIWKYAQENPLNGITGGTAGTALAVVQTGLAVGRAAGSVAKIAAFEKGGRTDASDRAALLAPWLGSIADRMAPGGSFAPGGPVKQATIGLIGEAGAELVIPNWLYADPRQANLMGFLEAQIASRGGAFATGGSTTGASGIVATDAADSDFGQIVGLMQQFVRGQQEFRDEISDWQRNIEVNLDPRKAKRALDVVTQVQQGGGLK